MDSAEYIEERNNYGTIDRMVLDFIRELFNISQYHDDDALWRFCVGHRLEGSLALMLPSAYYDIMK